MKLWKTALALALAGVLALALTGCSMLYARPNDVDLFDKDGMEAGDLWDRPVWEENDPLPSQDGGGDAPDDRSSLRGDPVFQRDLQNASRSARDAVARHSTLSAAP